MRYAQLPDFSITLPDRPGALARLASMMREADVNLLGLWGYGGTETARFYCVPESAEQFRGFAESAELEVREGSTFYITGRDSVGALVRCLETIAGAGVNLHAIQTIAVEGTYGTFVWAAPEEWGALTEALDAMA